MAATVVQSNAAAQNTGAATVTVSWNTPATAGNLLVVVAAGDDYRTAGGAPAGFTESTGCRQEGNLGHYLWWKVASGGETSTSYTIGSAATSCWLTAEVSGIAASPYDISAGQIINSGGDSYTTPAITPTAGDRFLLGSIGGSRSVALAGVDTWTNSFTEIIDVFVTKASGTRDTIGLAQFAATADGATAYSTGASYTTSPTPTGRSGIIGAWKVAAGGVATVTGSANLTAQSSLTATATTKGNVAGTAAFTSQSAQTAAARVDVPATASFTGASSLTATGATSTPAAPQVFATAALTSSGGIAATGHVDTRATTALTAAGLLTAAATIHHYATATLTGAGDLTARWTSGQVGDINATIGPPTRAWATGEPDRAWKAGPPTL